MEKTIAEKREWLDRTLGVLYNLPRAQDPPTTAAQIWSEKQVSTVTVLYSTHPPPLRL